MEHWEYLKTLSRYRKWLICLGLLCGIFFIVATVWISRLNTSLENLQSSYSRLANENISLTEQIETYTERIETYKDAVETFKDRYYAIEDEYNFYHTFAVIVTSKAGEKYHKYGCHYIDDRSFLILNINSAKSRGYAPCSYCYG